MNRYTKDGQVCQQNEAVSQCLIQNKYTTKNKIIRRRFN